MASDFRIYPPHSVFCMPEAERSRPREKGLRGRGERGGRGIIHCLQCLKPPPGPLISPPPGRGPFPETRIDGCWGAAVGVGGTGGLRFAEEAGWL